MRERSTRGKERGEERYGGLDGCGTHAFAVCSDVRVGDGRDDASPFVLLFGIGEVSVVFEPKFKLVI